MQVSSQCRSRQELMQSIQGNTDELQATFVQLRETALDKFNFKRQIIEDPWPWLVGGLVVGFLGGLRSNGR